jgi:hypothetical protein
MSEDVKHYIFIKNGRSHYTPQYLPVTDATVRWIFPIPEPNAVGTLDKQRNAIVSLKFGDYGAKPECKSIVSDFSKEICGEAFKYRFCPIFSDDTIVYCKTRVAVVANIKTGEAFHAVCGLSIGDYILGIRFLNHQENLFVILKSIDDGGSGSWKDYLHIAKLEGQKLIDTDWSMKIGETKYISPDFQKYTGLFRKVCKPHIGC